MIITIQKVEPELTLGELFEDEMTNDFIEKDRFSYDPLMMCHVLCDDMPEVFETYFDAGNGYERCHLTDEELDKVKKFMGEKSFQKNVEFNRTKSLLESLRNYPTYEKPWLMTVDNNGRNYERSASDENELKIYEKMLKMYENDTKNVDYILEMAFVEVF